MTRESSTAFRADLQHVVWTTRGAICSDLLALLDQIAPEDAALRERVWEVVAELADASERGAFRARLLESAAAGVIDDLALSTLARLGGRLSLAEARSVLTASPRAFFDATTARARLVALCAVIPFEDATRLAVEVLDAAPVATLAALVGAPAPAGPLAFDRWLASVPPDDAETRRVLCRALPDPRAAERLASARFEEWPPALVAALSTHGATLLPLLASNPIAEAQASEAFALPPAYVRAEHGDAAVRAALEATIARSRAAARTELDSSRSVRAAARSATYALRFAATWPAARGLVVELLDDPSTPCELARLAFFELRQLDAKSAHAWALRTPWERLVDAARIDRVERSAHGALDRGAEEDVRRALSASSAAVRRSAERLFRVRPDALERWRSELSACASRGSVDALAALLRHGCAEERVAARGALAALWVDTGAPARAAALGVLMAESPPANTTWRKACEALLRRARRGDDHGLRRLQHRAARALARLGDVDSKTRLLRVSLDPGSPSYAELLTRRA